MEKNGLAGKMNIKPEKENEQLIIEKVFMRERERERERDLRERDLRERQRDASLAGTLGCSFQKRKLRKPLIIKKCHCITRKQDHARDDAK